VSCVVEFRIYLSFIPVFKVFQKAKRLLSVKLAAKKADLLKKRGKDLECSSIQRCGIRLNEVTDKLERRKLRLQRSLAALDEDINDNSLSSSSAPSDYSPRTGSPGVGSVASALSSVSVR
jgi:hypothetical protein